MSTVYIEWVARRVLLSEEAVRAAVNLARTNLVKAQFCLVQMVDRCYANGTNATFPFDVAAECYTLLDLSAERVAAFPQRRIRT